ncbi:hypothetical protein HDU98_002613 [Podochytrium sp. JEL0797]|nr:hypothetical protein HDU98_002613 [Podochytrium sp. JEL0797]
MIHFTTAHETKPLLATSTATATAPIFLLVSPPRRTRPTVCQLLLCLLAVFFVVPHVLHSVCPRSFGNMLPAITGNFAFPASAFSSVNVETFDRSGSAEIAVLTSTTPEATIEFSTESNDLDALPLTTVTAEIDATKTLQIRIHFPANLPPCHSRRIHTKLTIALPQEIEKFTTTAQVASIHYNAPNAIELFGVMIQVGSVTVQSDLLNHHTSISSAVGSISLLSTVETRVLDLHSATGSVHASLATVSDRVALATNTGSIDAVVSGAFSHLEANADLGSIALDLLPENEEVDVKLASGTGRVKAFVSGFEGKFEASTGLGSVKVGGKKVHLTGSGVGYVGDDESGKGVLGARTGLGSVGLMFA